MELVKRVGIILMSTVGKNMQKENALPLRFELRTSRLTGYDCITVGRAANCAMGEVFG